MQLVHYCQLDKLSGVEVIGTEVMGSETTGSDDSFDVGLLSDSPPPPPQAVNNSVENIIALKLFTNGLIVITYPLMF